MANLTELIHHIRGHRVMLSGDLAGLYGVRTKVLVQAVKRNRKRFPEDFGFQLTSEEARILRSQIVTSSWGGTRFEPFAFTEQGVAMLSSVLRSSRAIEANISIMRAFVAARALASQNRRVLRKLSELESRVSRHDTEIGSLIDAIRGSLTEDEKPRRRIGFSSGE